MKIHLKKVFVSLLVIIGFVFYGFYQRFGDSLQTYFNNLQNRQVAAETYSDLDASSSKNQTSANPPLNTSKNTKEAYSEPSEFSQIGQDDNAISDSENTNKSLYKDGEYDGLIADAYYGSVQVRAIIESGKLSDVVFLSYPNDRSYSIEINKKAMPLLKACAINIQCAQVDIVAGATNTSKAFISSLDSALIGAKASSNTVSLLQTPYGTVDIVSGATAAVAAAGSSDVVSFLQNWGNTVDIVSGATNVSSGTGSAAADTTSIQNQSGGVDVVSGATNVSSGTTTTTTDTAAIQNQGGTVDVVSGATNVSSGTTTTTTDTTVIQNQETTVDVVSGATNVSSGDSSSDEEDSEDEHDEEDD
jgi:uncharacterized protein with FMN-binding domain